VAMVSAGSVEHVRNVSCLDGTYVCVHAGRQAGKQIAKIT
jgi:hypothetical protein